MTIAIGILASDGIVLAADSQEGDGYFTRAVQKILPWKTMNLASTGSTPGESACLLAGAGNAHFIDAFCDEFLSDIPAKANMHEFELYLGTTLKDFYEKHDVARYAMADHNDDFQMLIGAYFGWSVAYYVTYRSTWRRGRLGEAIGIGAAYAKSAISGLPFGSVQETELLAAGVIYDTKQCIEGCGRGTEIMSLHRPLVKDDGPGTSSHLEHAPNICTRVGKEKISRWEVSFGQKWALQQMRLMQKLVAEELAEDIRQLESHSSADSP